MKKLVIAILVMGLLITGLWWTIRRGPGTVPLADDTQTAFRVETVERGCLIRYDDPQTPLRSLKWLPPLRGGMVIVQVITQSDRQEISLFKNGLFQASYLVPKPLGVRDGFFRLAELREALVQEGETAVLLYTTPGASADELPLVLALDLRTKDIRWIHRALGEHLVQTDGPEGIVYLFGANTPPVRLPLALADGERTSPTGLRSVARPIDLPPEVLEISALEPTGPSTFLLAHKGGLSAFVGAKGWTHHPVPEGDTGLFKEARPALGGGGKKYWWQPFPGHLIQVLADGTPKATWPEFPAAEPFAKDASLLHLLGVDEEGKLWFDLAVPAEPSPAAPTAGTEAKPETPADSAAPAGPTTQDWPTYVGQGLDRIYCWDPQKKVLQRFKWAALAVPQEFQKPINGIRITPDSGALLLANGPSAWLLPLSALALGDPTTTDKPTQVK
jgi:hypothetical protein